MQRYDRQGRRVGRPRYAWLKSDRTLFAVMLLVGGVLGTIVGWAWAVESLRLVKQMIERG